MWRDEYRLQPTRGKPLSPILPTLPTSPTTNALLFYDDSRSREVDTTFHQRRKTCRLVTPRAYQPLATRALLRERPPGHPKRAQQLFLDQQHAPARPTAHCSTHTSCLARAASSAPLAAFPRAPQYQILFSHHLHELSLQRKLPRLLLALEPAERRFCPRPLSGSALFSRSAPPAQELQRGSFLDVTRTTLLHPRELPCSLPKSSGSFWAYLVL